MDDSRLCKEVNVWRRINEKTLLRYRCFHVLPNDEYCVQSADYYRFPFDDKLVAEFETQFLQLLAEDAPQLRVGKLYGSVEEAIAEHDKDFI